MNRNSLFSLIAQTEHKPENKKALKIELLACQSGGQTCKEHLSVINEHYMEAYNFHFDKDYLNSIGSLKCAFFKTCELKQESCVKCASLFRSTIRQSLENIHEELQNLTTGFLGNTRYHNSYKASVEVLNEIKQAE